MTKFVKLIWICFFIFTSNVSPSFAQEDNEGSAVKKKQSAKKNNPIKKTEKRFYRIETDTRLGWSSNVFKTPKGTYVDPETSALQKSSATDSYFINPDIELAVIPFEGERSKVELEYSWEGVFFPDERNLKNAEGYTQKLASEFEFDFVNEVSKNSPTSPSADSFVKKSSINAQIYRQQVKHNYLHRGTGELRNTKVAQIDEENRYQHWETGAYLDFKTRFTSGTRIGLSVGTYDRDYEDVVTLQSYDRNGFETEVEAEQALGSGWNGFAEWSEEKMQYDRHKASNATGSSVTGTKRKFDDTEISGGFEYDHGTIQSKLKFSNLKRDDLYIGYWSYNQDEVSFSLAKEWKSFGRLKLEGSWGKRRYKLETNTFGIIRKRKVDALEIEWDRDYRWGTLSAKLSQIDQNDTDSYYAYENTVAYIGLEKEF